MTLAAVRTGGTLSPVRNPLAFLPYPRSFLGLLLAGFTLVMVPMVGALAYSACFLGAMGAAAKRAGKKLPIEATVTADVSFADREDKIGFTMVPKLTAKVPGWEKADIEATMKVAHDICPISDLIRHAHEVELVAG